mmetsp:Transcript_13688/g.39032  ORF Transcript_13688/g.39032 Transcript_13688/m.39032 type:complete len:593 (+) Transcript_13688:70-1848(+)
MAGGNGLEEPPPLPKGVRKEVLRPPDAGEERFPQKGDECFVHYEGRFEVEGEPFDGSRSRGEPLAMRLGVGQVIKGWDLAVATMRRGEHARFTCAPEYAYGDQGAPPKIPGNATLIFDIELVNWRSEDDLFGDGGVIRTKVEEGSGFQEPADGSEVLCSFKATAADGRVLDERPSLEYKLGSGALGKLSRAVDRALTDMKKGGSVSLQCSESYSEENLSSVTVELTLLELLETEDISPGKDKTLMKRRLTEGDGYQKPKDGGRVRLTVEAASNAAGAAVPGFVGPRELEFTAGDGEVCDALEFLVVHMVQDERAVVICSKPAMCVDSHLGLDGLTSATEGKVSLTVQLHEFNNGTASWEMSGEEKVAYAAQRKEVGTKLFKAQRFLLALERFKTTAEFLRSYATVPEGGDEIVRLCDLNKAACMLKLSDYFGAKAACTTVLVHDPDNVKALFRRATAYMELHEFSEAVSDLKHLLALDSTNKEAQRLLPQAVRAAKQEEKKASSMFARMNKAFSGFAEAEERRVREAKEAHEAAIARKSAEAKAEAKKMREQRGDRSAEACKEDLQRASQSIMQLQKKCFEMSMGGPPGEDD